MLVELSRYLPVLLRSTFSRQQFDRILESSQITDQDDNVDQYNMVMQSKMACFYTAGLELIHRVTPEPRKRIADLACGPGHVTRLFADHFEAESIDGFDLSEGMLKNARKNVTGAKHADRIQFTQADITDLPAESDYYDLCSCTFAIHHLPTNELVTKAISEMERVTKADGLVVLFDVARLPTIPITEDFVKVAGKEYLEQGMPEFYSDFKESMLAAFTVKELANLVPENTNRTWYQLVTGGIPAMQIIVGLPEGQTSLFKTARPDYSHLVPDRFVAELKITRLLFATGPIQKIR